MSTNMGDPTGAAPRSKLKGIDQATNPRWATAKVTVRGTIVVLSLAATITSLVYCSAPKRWDTWILLSPLYAIPYVSPTTYADLQGWSNGSPLPAWVDTAAQQTSTAACILTQGYHGSHF